MPIPDRVKNDPNFPVITADSPEARDIIVQALPLPNIKVTEVDTALSAVDQNAIWDVERPKVVSEVWDRTSPINGVSADVVLATRTDIPATGDVVLVKDTSGNVIMFQPHEPGAPGIKPIPVGQGSVRGSRMSEDIVASRVTSETARLVAEKILAARGGK